MFLPYLRLVAHVMSFASIFKIKAANSFKKESFLSIENVSLRVNNAAIEA